MTDIVIGARRSHAPRPLRALGITVLLLGVAALVAFVIFRRVVSYPVPDGEISKEPVRVETEGAGGARLVYAGSSLSHEGSLSVLRLVGEPHTLGAARGRLLGEALEAPTSALGDVIDSTQERDGFFSELTHPARVRWSYRDLDDAIPGHQLREVVGLSRGGRGVPDYEALVRLQAALDVGAPSPASRGHALRTVARSLSFVSPLRGAGQGRLVIGRSFALPGAADGGASASPPVVAFVHPEGVLPFASVGWPGLVGVVSGVNAEAIAVFVHPARSRGARPERKAQPVGLLARDVLENARSLEDAIGILEKAEPLGTASYLLVDGDQGSWAVVERSPEKIAVERDPSSPVVTDLLSAEPFVDDPENDRAHRTRPQTMRAERARELLDEALEEPEDAAAVLRDRRAAGGGALPLGHRGGVEDLSAAHAAVFDVSAMVLWVSEGPGASGRFRAFDLRHELAGEGRRPAPPPDFLAAEALDPAVPRAVLMSRRDLRRARRAWQSGSKKRARELAARALERVPELPEALLTAGHFARESGEDEAALTYYRRYLDGGPDDLGAATQIRARLDNR